MIEEVKSSNKVIDRNTDPGNIDSSAKLVTLEKFEDHLDEIESAIVQLNALNPAHELGLLGKKLLEWSPQYDIAGAVDNLKGLAKDKAKFYDKKIYAQQLEIFGQACLLAQGLLENIDAEGDYVRLAQLAVLAKPFELGTKLMSSINVINADKGLDDTSFIMQTAQQLMQTHETRHQHIQDRLQDVINNLHAVILSMLRSQTTVASGG